MSICQRQFFYQYSLAALQSPQRSARRRARGAPVPRSRGLAVPPPGAEIVAYRWMLTATPSTSGAAPTSRKTCTTGARRRERDVGDNRPILGWRPLLLRQGRGQYGAQALATVHFRSVEATFKKSLLIVDDTRRSPDNFLADGTLLPVATTWPAAAELDTFLYAVGGVPWRRAPAGMLSPQGVLAGFDYDTIGPHGVGGGDAAAVDPRHLQTRRLDERLRGRVEHEAVHDPSNPMPLLAYMTTRAR